MLCDYCTLYAYEISLEQFPSAACLSQLHVLLCPARCNVLAVLNQGLFCYCFFLLFFCLLICVDALRPR